jgi:hypothetical protein
LAIDSRVTRCGIGIYIINTCTTRGALQVILNVHTGQLTRRPQEGGHCFDELSPSAVVLAPLPPTTTAAAGGFRQGLRQSIFRHLLLYALL